MTMFKATPLSSSATEMLGQLFLNGPTWDGNVVSTSAGGEKLVGSKKSDAPKWMPKQDRLELEV